MRCSQPMGLPDAAREFLRTNAVRSNPCSACGRDDGYETEVIGPFGMLDEFMLYRYRLIDGGTAEEYIQHEVWDSGPVIWLALKWEGMTLEWSEKDMDGE